MARIYQDSTGAYYTNEINPYGYEYPNGNQFVYPTPVPTPVPTPTPIPVPTPTPTPVPTPTPTPPIPDDVVNDLVSNVYTPFNLVNDKDVVFSSKESISLATWTDNNTELTSFFYDDSKNNRDYFLNSYDVDPVTNEEANIQFSISFGNVHGCGAPSVDASFTDDNSPTKAIYYNIKHVIGQEANDKIIINDVELDRIFAISIRQEQLQDKIKPSAWNLHVNFNSTDVYFIDNQSTSVDTTLDKYSIIAVNSDGTPFGGSTTIVGTVFLDKGLIILDVDVIETLVGATVFSNCGLDSINCSGSACDTVATGFADTNNNAVFLDGIQSFVMISEIATSSIIYFVRIKHDRYNHSNNTTYVQNDNGDLIYSSMVDNPFTYITTIGLYNDTNELLAVAKTSRPILKTYEREALVRVKLTF